MISKNKEKSKIRDGLEEFFSKDRVNILVTDSGLGGVCVAADVYERLKNSGIFTHGNVIFFNAQAHPEYGYNKMATDEEKIAVFDESLKKMDEKFKPDILLIACNTLSVLYAKTRHAKTTKYPVIGIVETGVSLIKQSLKKEPNSDIFIFGTETTIGQGTHRKMLTKLGVAADKIYTQACPGLADAIDNSPRGKETIRLVRKYVLEALEGYKGGRKSMFVSLNCTHFGYSADLFIKEFAVQGFKNAKILNPNPRMADFMFEPKHSPKAKQTKVTIKFASQYKMAPNQLLPISKLIKVISPQTSAAMVV